MRMISLPSGNDHVKIAEPAMTSPKGAKSVSDAGPTAVAGSSVSLEPPPSADAHRSPRGRQSRPTTPMVFKWTEADAEITEPDVISVWYDSDGHRFQLRAVRKDDAPLLVAAFEVRTRACC